MLLRRGGVNHRVQLVDESLARPFFHVLIDIHLPVVVVGKAGAGEDQVGIAQQLADLAHEARDDVAAEGAPAFPQRVGRAHILRADAGLRLLHKRQNHILVVAVIVVIVAPAVGQREADVVKLDAVDVVARGDLGEQILRPRPHLGVERVQ